MSVQELDLREFRALAHASEGQILSYYRGDNAEMTGR
ncbi:unannotated protein [freshwater metagenome]|jgi:hypothetical protein|uniref:Unannotated protein n=1 Tax=freshwater metagenome TaxID=449393 RepID=A0A6J6ZX45_9ZZZZ